MDGMTRAIGLMSGTSLDGVDIALIDTDGESRIATGPVGFEPYDERDRALLREALGTARDLQDRTSRPAPLDRAEHLVTEQHVTAVSRFLERYGIAREAIAVVGFHGQTVLHRPSDRLTVQIGDGAMLAERLGIKVVADLRAADVAAGGQGAPLVPVYHRALVRDGMLVGATLVINIGGVSNVTYVAGDDDPVAWDTGPGNALIDDLMLERTGSAIDRDGATAAAGHVDVKALARLLDHSFFALPPPKSLDRNDFTRTAVDALSTPDAAATLTAFTAAAIAACLTHLPQPPARAVVCGGGAHNAALMGALRGRMPCPVMTGRDLGWLPDAIEAQAFAYLAVRSCRGLPLTFPTTTGVSAALSGGVLFRP